MRIAGRWAYGLSLLLGVAAAWGVRGGEATSLSTIEAVQALPRAAAASGLPVDVRGLVTYWDPATGTLFLQDATAGARVVPADVDRDALRVGQEVRVRGRTRPGAGAVAHSIDAGEVTILGEAVLPKAVRLSFQELRAGRVEGRWVEVDGVVRQVWSGSNRFEMDVVVDGGRLRLVIPRPAGTPVPTGLVHARVRVRGVGGLSADEQGTVAGVVLFVAETGFVEVREPPVEADQLPRWNLADVAAANADLLSPARIRVEGMVTGLTPEGRVFLQEDDVGVEVLLMRPRALLEGGEAAWPAPVHPELKPGHRVIVSGYPAVRERRAVLEEAEVTIMGRAALPEPWRPLADEWWNVGLDARLLEVEGRFLYFLPRERGETAHHRFLVQVGDVLLTVHLPISAVEPFDSDMIEDQAALRLTGVARADTGEAGRIQSWHLWLRGVRDIAPLPSPSVWPSGGTWRLVALAGWALLLWGQLRVKRVQAAELEARVRARTSELEAANASLRREAVERERTAALQSAIYRISEATHSVRDLPDLYRQLHQIIGTLMPARNFLIAWHDPATDLLSFPYFADEKSDAPEARPWSNGLSEYVIRTRQPLLADAARIAALVAAGQVRRFGKESRIWLGVPLVVQGRATGVMAVQDYTDADALDASHQQILMYVAGQTATAIERKRAEAELQASQMALRASQQRFLNAFAGSPAIMTLARLSDGTLFEVNEAFLAMTGYCREEVIGRSTVDLNVWVDSADREALLRDVRRSGSVRDRQLEVRTRDGRRRTVLLAASLVEIDGEPSVLAASLDVTARRDVEMQLRRALAREKELGELKSGFVTLVSHEFRTPLEVILSSAEILERYHERLAAGQRAKQVRAIQSSVRRMAEMMNEMLLLGRIEAGRVEFHLERIDVPALQRRLRDEIRAASGDGAVIELSAEGDLHGAAGDDSLLSHIFTNLLSNAVKYSLPGSPVRFSVTREEEMAVFVVADRGCGIPEADQPRIFQSFQRGGNVGERSGTGLGLVIVKRCVERHGGQISFVSREGEGTTFTVRLPLFRNGVPRGPGTGPTAVVAPVALFAGDPVPQPEVTPG